MPPHAVRSRHVLPVGARWRQCRSLHRCDNSRNASLWRGEDGGTGEGPQLSLELSLEVHLALDLALHLVRTLHAHAKGVQHRDGYGRSPMPH